MNNIVTGIVLIGIGLVMDNSLFFGDITLFNLFFDGLGLFFIGKGLFGMLGSQSAD